MRRSCAPSNCRDHSLPPGPGRAAPPIFSDLIYDRHGREKFRFGTHYRGRGPAPPLGYATWFGQCHMFVGILAMRTIVPRTAPAVLSLEVNLWQGSQMASQLELSPRAALRRCSPPYAQSCPAPAQSWSRGCARPFAAPARATMTGAGNVSKK